MMDWGYGLPNKDCDNCKEDIPCDEHRPEKWKRQVGGDHYRMPIEPLEFIMANNLPYCEANVVKYCCRHEKKGGAEDILKAISYLKILLQEKYSDK